LAFIEHDPVNPQATVATFKAIYGAPFRRNERTLKKYLDGLRRCGLLTAGSGPTLPSSASARHGSYLGISCRQLRCGITAEDDPLLTSELVQVIWRVPRLVALFAQWGKG